jgi:hypothetical protein
MMFDHAHKTRATTPTISQMLDRQERETFALKAGAMLERVTLIIGSIVLLGFVFSLIFAQS